MVKMDRMGPKDRPRYTGRRFEYEFSRLNTGRRSYHQADGGQEAQDLVVAFTLLERVELLIADTDLAGGAQSGAYDAVSPVRCVMTRMDSLSLSSAANGR